MKLTNTSFVVFNIMIINSFLPTTLNNKTSVVVVIVVSSSIRKAHRDAWVVQSVNRPTLDHGSGHDLTVHEFELHTGFCTDGVEPAWDSVSPSLCSSPACALSLSK